jgi:CBS domain-containing protein
MTLVADVMATDLCMVSPHQSTQEAAALMRDRGIGDVLVVESDRLVGLVTDRDLAVRLVADGMGPDTAVSQICTSGPVAVATNAPIGEAVRLMREHSIRRLPVVEDGGRPVGIITIGDLAMETDPRSALAEISEAPDNN